MGKKEAKARIEKLVKKYKNLGPEKAKKYNEANTRKDFVLPLFRALGWDVYNTKEDEVIEEEIASGKRVDYAFKLDGITKFYLEAKPFSADLDEERWADQAIWYAWHKSVPWAILTDFESIKMYNAEWDTPKAENNLFFEIEHKDYLKEFEQLWWLSRQSFKNETLDEQALKYGRKPKRVPVDKQLASDLMRWRDLLYDELRGGNSSINDQKISESVQEILDRLIFIRTTEDRGMEERTLLGMVRTWRDSKKTKVGDLVDELNKLFREYDKNYNSKLFNSRFCEELDIDDNIYVNIINELYKNRKGIRYNFADINADVFGSIYEQYLSYIQQNGEKDRKKKTKRKSQGIYYTPRYIVNYIIKNTLRDILKEKSAEQVKTIKILDPACGSGSFLIRALEELISFWQVQLDKRQKYNRDSHLGKLEKTFKAQRGRQKLTAPFKMGLLRNNIYGVDLDKEAAEIAQLNLLLKIMERRRLLPDLSNNIACGNSLISGDEKELKKYFGRGWKNKEVFNWEKEFKEVFKYGGFDMIVGNPPYISNKELLPDEKAYFRDKYEVAFKQYDILLLFIEKGLELLKKGGYLGFIVSNKFLASDYGLKLRRYLLNKTIIKEIIDVSNLKIFGDAAVYPVIIILQKRISKDYKIKLCKIDKGSQLNRIDDICTYIPNTIYKEIVNNIFITNLTKKSYSLINKMNKNSEPLSKIYKGKKVIRCGIASTELFNKVTKKKEPNSLNHLAVSNIHRYKMVQSNNYINKEDLPKGLLDDFLQRKIVIAGVAERLRATIDGDKSSLGRIYYITNCDYDFRFVLALLNSKLLNFYYRMIYGGIHLAGGFLRFNSTYLENLPIYKIDFSNKKEGAEHGELIKLVNKILKLNKKLQKLHPEMDDKEYNEIKLEIEEIDKLIDQKVYELYGLTKKEIKIVEGTK